MSTLHQIVARLEQDNEYQLEAGVTFDAFRSWSNAMKRKYLGDHPTSTFFDRLGIRRPEHRKQLKEHHKQTHAKQKELGKQISKLEKKMRKVRDPEERAKHEAEIDRLINESNDHYTAHDELKNKLRTDQKVSEQKRKEHPVDSFRNLRSQLVSIKKNMKELAKQIKKAKKAYKKRPSPEANKLWKTLLAKYSAQHNLYLRIVDDVG